jgi:methyl-accepting chemotaxis protein
MGISPATFDRFHMTVNKMRFLEKFLKPGVLWMGNFGLKTKLSGLMLALLFPLVGAATLWSNQPGSTWATLGSVGAAAGVLIGIYVFACFYLSLTQPLTALQDAVRAGSHGDLTKVISVTGTDELAHIGQDLERMNEGMSGVIGQVRSQIVLVGVAGEKLAQNAGELSNRTESQAASLEQSSASIQELSGSVRRNADSAQQIDQLFRS